MSVVFLYPNDMFNVNAVDEQFTVEYSIVVEQGFGVALFDANSHKIRGILDEGSTVVYRGWMLTPQQYSLLNNQVLNRNAVMLTSPEQYLAAHHIVGWVDMFTGLTFPTVVFPEPVNVASIERKVS